MANPQSREHGNKNRQNAGGNVQKELSNKASDVVDKAEETAEGFLEGSPGDTLKRTATTVIDAVEQVANEFRRGSGDATKIASEYGGRAATYAKSHPWQAIMALGVFGVLLGMILKPRKAS